MSPGHPYLAPDRQAATAVTALGATGVPAAGRHIIAANAQVAGHRA